MSMDYARQYNEAMARIAELEAELYGWREANDRVWRALPKNLPGDEPGTVDASVHVAWMAARIAELEAERDNIKEINEIIIRNLRDEITRLKEERAASRRRDRARAALPTEATEPR